MITKNKKIIIIIIKVNINKVYNFIIVDNYFNFKK